MAISVSMALASLAVLVPILVSRTNVAAWAVVVVLAVQVWVPSFYSPAGLQLAVNIACIFGLFVTVGRSRERIAIDLPWLLFVLLSLLVWVSHVRGASPSYGTQMAVVAVMLVLLFSVMRMITLESFHIFVRGFALVLIVQAGIALLEQVGVLGSIWPRTDESDFIGNRRNGLLPQLPGRSMGSLAQPIPLGVVAAFGVVLGANQLTRHPLASTTLLAGSLIALGLSGTRSAVVAVVLGIVVLLFFARRKVWAWCAVLCALLAVPFGLGGAILETLGLGSEFQGTTSYVHRAQVPVWIGILLEREPFDVVFGGGYASTARMFESGILPGVGLTVFDQEFVKTFSASGLVGLAVLGSLVVYAFIAGDAVSRGLLATLLVTFLFFDTLSWRIGSVLFCFALGLAFRSSQHRSQLEDKTQLMSRKGSEGFV